MNPIVQARAVYDAEPCARCFEEDLEAHLMHGWTVSTPEVFVMARLVPKSGDPEYLVDPWHVWAPEDCDTWLIYLAAGAVQVLPSLAPIRTRYVAFERSNRLRFWKFSAFARLWTTSSASISTLTLSAPMGD